MSSQVYPSRWMEERLGRKASYGQGMQNPLDLIDRAAGEHMLSHMRGGILQPQWQAHRKSLRYLEDPFHIPLGSVYLPEMALFHGIAFVGSSGTGKSIGIDQIKRNRLDHVGKGHGHRVLIYDYKGRERTRLEPLDLSCRVHYLNPLDARGVGIDLAAELTGPLEADNFAADLIDGSSERMEGGDNMTFRLAAQAIVSGVIKVFQQTAPGRWRFLDVLEACRSEKRLREVLPYTNDGLAMVEDLLGSNRQAKGLMMTLAANVTRLMPVATAMVGSENISLREWVEGEESVLVLSNVDKYEANLAPFFRWVFKHTLKLLMSREQDRGETYTFFVDEARQAPFAEDLLKLATEGREYRAGFVLGFQDVQGMNRVLNADGTGELFSCCSTQLWFQNNNPESARFASERFGTQLLRVADYSATRNTGRNTNAAHLSDEQKDAVTQDYIYRDQWSRVYDGPGEVGKESAGIADIRGFRQGMGGLASDLYFGRGMLPNGGPISEQDSTGEGITASVRPAEYPMVYPSEILHQEKPDPLPGPDSSLTTTAYVASTFLGNWQEIAYDMNLVTMPRDRSVRIFEPLPNENLYYEGWTDEDERRLGLL